MITIMGIDPSINYTGYAFITDGYLDSYDLINVKRETRSGNDQTRLRYLFKRLGYIMDMWQPNAVVIEDYQWRASNVRHRNKDFMKKLIWAIGVCICSVPDGIDAILIKPQEWKGSKEKLDTVRECREQFGITDDLNNNCADAIMLASHYYESVSEEG